jgi:hypothetical protein
MQKEVLTWPPPHASTLPLPQALGEHDSEVKFQVISKSSCRSRTPLVLSSVSVAVMGSSLALSTKRGLPGGPEATPENFTKQR